MTTLPFTCRNCGNIVQFEAERRLRGLGALVQPMQPATPQTIRCDTCGSYWYADRDGTDLVIGEDHPGDLLGNTCPDEEKASSLGSSLLEIMTKQVKSMHKCAELYRRYLRDCKLHSITPVDPPDGHVARKYSRKPRKAVREDLKRTRTAP